ncbi:MAG: hypothetical protein AAGJ10_05310 [Bacteroidota bacterium]
MRVAILAALALLATSCGSSGNLLGEYPPTGQLLAVTVMVPQHGESVRMRTFSDDFQRGRTPGTADLGQWERYRALQDQLDETLQRMDTSGLIGYYASEQGKQRLEVVPTDVADEAGLVLDVKLRTFDAEVAQSRNYAWVDATGEARLIDGATGRVVWRMPLNTAPRRTAELQNPAVRVTLTSPADLVEQELVSAVDRLCEALAQYIVRQLERDYQDAGAS